MGTEIQTLEKQPGDNRLYDMDFAANMSDGETISAVSSYTAAPSGLTLGAHTFSGTKVQKRISGGTAGSKYKITVVVTTSAGNTLEGDGYLFVREE